MAERFIAALESHPSPTFPALDESPCSQSRHEPVSLCLRRLARALLALVLIFAPWAFGTTEHWSLIALSALTGTASILAAAGGWRMGRFNGQWPWAALVLALALYMTMQAVNASHRYQLVDQSLISRSHIAWLPHSADSMATWWTLGKFLTYAALFWAAAVSFRHDSKWKWLLTVLVINGFLMAMFGIVQNLSGTRELFWIRPPGYRSDIFGPFVNPNNYSAYMNLLVPVALAMGRSAQRRAQSHKSHPGYLFYFMAAVMIVSVVMSKSRAGIVICLLLTASWLFLCWRIHHGETRGLLVPVGLLAVTASVILVWIDTAPIETKLARLQDVPEELTGSGQRAGAYRGTLAMFCDRWFLGIGAGTFAAVFPYYQPPDVIGSWQYAHCDWLQYLAELGIVGSGILVAVGIAASRRRQSATPAHEHRSSRSMTRHAVTLALGGLGLHAVVDFPLHIAGVTTLAVVYFALLSRYPGIVGGAEQTA